MTPATDAAREALVGFKGWLESIRDIAWDEIVANGGVTAWMVIQQEARTVQLPRVISALTEAASQPREGDGGWIVGNNVGQWRTFDSFGWAWTDRRDLAVRYARRSDAELVHGDDEDSWRVEQYQALTQRPPEQAGAVPAGIVTEMVDAAKRDIARTQTDFLGRMAQCLCTYEGLFGDDADGELSDDDREEADDAIAGLAALALAQVAMLRHPDNPAAMLSAAPTPPDADEAKRDAWSEFETEHLADGKGQATAQVYARCREAFDAHWPQGWEKANAAAFAALSPPDAGIGSDGAGESDLIGLAEAARDLLELQQHDQRTVGFRQDRWDCLADCLKARS